MRIDLAKTINLSNDETQAGLRTAGLSHLAGKHRIESARVEKLGQGIVIGLRRAWKSTGPYPKRKAAVQA